MTGALGISFVRSRRQVLFESENRFFSEFSNQTRHTFPYGGIDFLLAFLFDTKDFIYFVQAEEQRQRIKAR